MKFLPPNRDKYPIDTHPPLFAFYSVESAAIMAGLTPELLVSAITHGDVKRCRILHLGPRRLRYIRSAPFFAWLVGIQPPEDPGQAADLAIEHALANASDPIVISDSLFE